MLEAFLGAMQNFAHLSFVLWVLAGVLVGLIVGIIPGISGMTVLAVFLPFCFVLKPEQALPFMIAVESVTWTGGVITAVLLGIPGDAPNVASCLDGYPMTKRGEVSRALGLALISSGLGGITSALMVLIVMPLVLIIVYALFSADMVFVILLGILCIGALSGKSKMEGLIAGGLGLLVSFIGFDAGTGIPRFTYGSVYLYDGLPVLPMALGLFAMPVMIDLIMQGGSIAKGETVVVKIRDAFRAGLEVLRHAGIFIRGTVIGYLVGVIPGIGSGTATWMSYAQAKATSKNAAEFGKGAPEGLIAASCATNASLAGDLLCTLALGIPGSTSMAILLGGIMMLGLVPGPAMLTEHASLSLSLIYVVFVANLIGAAICLFFVPQLARVAYIPAGILVALITPVILVGTYAVTQEFGDLIVLLAATVLGVAMDKFGFSRPALFVGYILGDLFERYFFISYKASGPLFFVRPISLTLIVIILGIVAYRPLKRLLVRARPGRVSKRA